MKRHIYIRQYQLRVSFVYLSNSDKIKSYACQSSIRFNSIVMKTIHDNISTQRPLIWTCQCVITVPTIMCFQNAKLKVFKDVCKMTVISCPKSHTGIEKIITLYSYIQITIITVVVQCDCTEMCYCNSLQHLIHHIIWCS